MCILCTTYKPVDVGQRCWVDYGSRTLRKDTLLLHEKSMQHCDELRAAMSHKRDIADGLASMESERQAATEDALKVLYFILRHNLPLDLFADLVELSVDLGPHLLCNPQAEKNATHTSAKTVQWTVEVVVGGGQHYNNGFHPAITHLQCDGRRGDRCGASKARCDVVSLHQPRWKH